MMVSADHDSRRAGTIWTLSLDEARPSIAPQVPAAFFRLDLQAASELAEVMGSDSLPEILKRFKRGSRCYAARVDGKLAAYGWVSFQEEAIGELSLRVRLFPGEAYIWNCVTLPEFRQHYLYTALLVFVVDELSAEHFSRVWIGADLENIPSQRGIARAGFIHIADLIVARVLALRQVWVQGRVNISDDLVDEARRVFLNNRDKVWSNLSPSVLSDR